MPPHLPGPPHARLIATPDTYTCPFDLTGRVILVTGASSGIGAAFVRMAASGGARVAAAARRADRLADMCAQVAAAGGQARAVTMDVTDESSIIAGFDAAEAAFGPVDTVIANAGVGSGARATDMPAEAFDQVIATNLRGVFLTAREGARRMIAHGSPAHGRGRIVIVSSVTAVAVSRGMAAYSASKAAVVQMGRVLAADWARQGINVNMLLPGYIQTDMTADLFATAAGQAMLQKFPRRRLMAEADVLPLMAYLAADASACVTGSAFTIDDGQML